MRHFIQLILPIFLIYTSCQSQSKPADKSSNQSSFDKSIPQDIVKEQVSSANLLEWQSITPIKTHRASWHRDYIKPEYKKQNEIELIQALGSFSIINNGTIYAQANSLHFFSRDHGHNWYEFEPFTVDGLAMSDVLGSFTIYHTADFFVLKSAKVSHEPQNGQADNSQYRYHISNNGSVWKEANTSDFNFDDHIRGRLNNLLYKKVNPETFDKLNSTYPNNYHTLIYDLEKVTATIYPYKDEKYILPKELHYGSKWMYRLCDGSFVHPRSNFPHVERGTTLSNLDKIVYQLEDSLQLADGKSRINNSKFYELGCHISTQLTVKDERGYRIRLLAVLSNNSETPSKLELVDHKPIGVHSSQNGKYMIRNREWPMTNKNRLACRCID